MGRVRDEGWKVIVKHKAKFLKKVLNIYFNDYIHAAGATYSRFVGLYTYIHVSRIYLIRITIIDYVHNLTNELPSLQLAT